MNKYRIVGLFGVLAMAVGSVFVYAAVSAIIDGYVMDGGKYNKTKYARKDNPVEFKRIADSMMMFGIVGIICGGGMCLIGFGGTRGLANQSLKPSPLRVVFQSPGSGQEFAD